VIDGQTKNAVLKTALSFHYQVLIGLEKCFSLEEKQSIWFEKDGDVSFLGGEINDSSQIEVKNYADALTDHHENFWNTLKNWLDPLFDHEKYGALILYTTQSFGQTTRLKNWNTQTAEQRFNTLENIFSERSKEELDAKKPKEIVKLQKLVMQANPEKIQKIIKKVTLLTEADDADSLRKSIQSKLIGIPINNQKKYLQELVGFVYDQADKNSWEVRKKDFTAKCEELTSVYRKKEFTFPPFIGYEATESDVSRLQEKLFVQKIDDIEHYEVIPEAIGNWLELQNSLIAELDEYPLYREKTKNYQNQIVKRFQRCYSTAQLEFNEPIKDSKILYNKIIAEQPLNLGNEIPPIEYKNGLIHDAMDDNSRDLKWKVE